MISELYDKLKTLWPTRYASKTKYTECSKLYDQLQTAIYDLESEYRKNREILLADLNHVEKWHDA